MIGVAIPAHNEEACLGACLQAVLRAATHPQLAGEPVMVCVVLDAWKSQRARLAVRVLPAPCT
jgi:hypothetical protein